MNSDRQVPPKENQVNSVFILGTPISLVTMDQVIGLLAKWTSDRSDRYIVFRDVHGVVRARTDAQLNKSHQDADIVAPDGMPLVWAMRAGGHDSVRRVCGPDMLPAVCEYGVPLGWRHYFYGGAPGVADKLATELTKRFAGLIVAGINSPPFRLLTSEEDSSVCAEIRRARPDLIWVGLGTPKQEIWMAEHRGQFGGVTMLGIGAAFDIHAKLVKRAPKWMQGRGLEWLHRLLSEPRRLWRRYIVLAPQFVMLAASEDIRRRFSAPLLQKIPEGDRTSP
jgi:N-acetylglucosaminyldiphosphoundecaprenol N-acetyl-beta-D-mannosaminyltransferase